MGVSQSLEGRRPTDPDDSDERTDAREDLAEDLVSQEDLRQDSYPDDDAVLILRTSSSASSSSSSRREALEGRGDEVSAGGRDGVRGRREKEEERGISYMGS